MAKVFMDSILRLWRKEKSGDKRKLRYGEMLFENRHFFRESVGEIKNVVWKNDCTFMCHSCSFNCISYDGVDYKTNSEKKIEMRTMKLR